MSLPPPNQCHPAWSHVKDTIQRFLTEPFKGYLNGVLQIAVMPRKAVYWEENPDPSQMVPIEKELVTAKKVLGNTVFTIDYRWVGVVWAWYYWTDKWNRSISGDVHIIVNDYGTNLIYLNESLPVFFRHISPKFVPHVEIPITTQNGGLA